MQTKHLPPPAGHLGEVPVTEEVAAGHGCRHGSRRHAHRARLLDVLPGFACALFFGGSPGLFHDTLRHGVAENVSGASTCLNPTPAMPGFNFDHMRLPMSSKVTTFSIVHLKSTPFTANRTQRFRLHLPKMACLRSNVIVPVTLGMVMKLLKGWVQWA